MKLLEYQAKEVFRKFGIPTPRGEIAKKPEEVARISKKLGSVAIKAQIPTGGRGKSGGIRFADSPENAKEIAGDMLGHRINNLLIDQLLIEEKVDIKQELYLGVVVDRGSRGYVILASVEGGIDIEEVASSTPEKIVKHFVDPIRGLRGYDCRALAKKMGFTGRDMRELADLIEKLYLVAYEMDAELTEINPLVFNDDGFVAADARLNIDNNALYRHPDFVEETRLFGQSELSEREIEARVRGLTYVELNGNIGIIGNGAGLTMATLDTVTLLGGKPANFLDLGGGASLERIKEAFSFVIKDPRVKIIFVNILGGITRCDDTARGIIIARREQGLDKPLVVRLVGTNEEEGKRILANEGIPFFDTMEEAAELAVALSRGN